MKRFLLISIGIIIGAIATISFSQLKNKNIDSSIIEEKDIYATFNFVSGDTVIDMDDISEVYEFADVVIIGEITEKSKATMSEISSFPYTPGKIKVNKVIKGDKEQEEIEFFMPGGTCTVEEFINGNKALFERSEKMGLTKLTKFEKQNKYIRYNFERSQNFDVGKQYIAMLKYCNEKQFTNISNVGFIELNHSVDLNSINDISDILSINNIN